jgi:PAS domain S-box-containing protein
VPTAHRPLSAPPLPPHEEERLRALAELGVATPDPALDDIARIAAGLAGAPIAQINVVEQGRQRTLASVGLPGRDLPREQSFCAHAILEPDRPLLVADTHDDPRFAANPLVSRGEGVRFYTGMPLVTREGRAIGALCVLDHVPRTLDDWQRESLDRLASLAVSHLEARQSARRLDAVESLAGAVIEHALDAIVTIDEDGTVIGWNPGAERCFGYSTSEAVGSNLGELIVPPALRASHRSGMRRYIETGRHVVLDSRLELTGLHADGREIPVELTVTHVSSNPHVFTAYLRDITERRLAEQAIREQNEKLIALDELRDNLVARVSHELRTPVTSISSLVELLSDEEEIPAKQRLLLGTVHRSARRLVRLVDDLLLLAEDDGGGVRLLTEQFEPALLVEDVRAELGGEASRRGIGLTARCTLREPVVGDRMRILQAIDNIVANALRFTPDGGRVALRLGAAGREHWRVEVADSGIGIPAGEIDRLCDPFYRASTAVEKSIHGSGLGLSIVHAIVSSHGGSIRIDSTVGKGTTVTLLLPRRMSAEAP